MTFYHFVYILKCIRNGEITFYTGMTNNPKRRLHQHKQCRCKYTKRFYGNVNMVYLERLEHRNKKTVSRMAWRREKQIKPYTQEKKRQLIRRNQKKTNELIRQYIMLG